MKRFNLRKLLSMLAIIIIIENGSVIIYNTADDTGSYSEDEGISPNSDQPYPDDIHD